MKKKIIFASVFAMMLFSTPKVDAKVYEFAYIFDDGCTGKMYVHSVLWGLFEWVSNERLSCP